jgi:hypothetical protein
MDYIADRIVAAMCVAHAPSSLDLRGGNSSCQCERPTRRSFRVGRPLFSWLGCLFGGAAARRARAGASREGAWPRTPQTALSLNNLTALLLYQGDLAGARPLWSVSVWMGMGNGGCNHAQTCSAHPESATSGRCQFRLRASPCVSVQLTQIKGLSLRSGNMLRKRRWAAVFPLRDPALIRKNQLLSWAVKRASGAALVQ